MCLVLSFHIVWMNCLSGILEHGIAQDFHITGFRIYLGINQMGGEADTGAVGIDFAVTGNRTAGGTRLGCDIGQGQRFMLAGIGAGRARGTIFPGYGFDRYAPDAGCALTHLADCITRCVDRRQAGREGHTAAIGYVIVSQ